MTTMQAAAVRAAILEMKAYSLEQRDARDKLDQNENPFDFPPELKEEVVKRILGLPWNRYPDFELTRIRQAIATAFGLSPENILAGNGSNELLLAAVATFVEPARRVIYAQPSFALYEKLVTIAGGTPVPVRLDPTTGALPVKEMTRLADHSSVIIVCSPNNPTGGGLEAGDLDRLLDTGATVLLDRAYGDFAGDSMPPLDNRLVVFSTFSKAWGLAGLRLGWIASSAGTVREIRKVKLPYNLNVLSQEAAIAALENPGFRDRYVSFVVAERERLFAALSEIGGIEPFPSRANFITLRLSRAASGVFDSLRQRGVLVRNVSGYPGLDRCLRVSVGETEQNDRFLKALKEVLS
jgi:histidinol-phosphate aminotransferase